MSISNEDLQNKINKILSVLKKIDNEIENIDLQIFRINGTYIQYEFNKNLKLKQPNSYLKFQVELLLNEKNYLNNLKKIFIRKFFKELFSISNYIVIILISLEDLDIGYEKEKNDIMNKIMKINYQKKIDYNQIIDIINVITNNLKQTDILIGLFNRFINNSYHKNERKNIHTKNFKLNLMNKKNHIKLEYDKYCEQLNLLVDYFFTFASNIDTFINKNELLNFFISNKNT